MKMLTNSPIDKLLDGGLEKDAITNIYGPPGTGKTNIALSATLACLKDKKVAYVDTEGSFSLERFKQMGGTEKDLKNIIMVHVHDWKEQHKKIMELEKIIEKEKDVGLVVVDSLVALYRLEMDEKNFSLVNKQLATQYSIFSKITRTKNIPILVTNQVYSKGDEIEITSRQVARYWSKTLVELRRLEKDNQRIAILRKHRSLAEGRSIEFEITEKGLKETKVFGVF
ncbi:MAG: DNA repair and recombination protein RadB [Candidatus Aenigmarchaeota archaeon]|nr:DNA repair and recombination protein RadB [Candidatus Aenigmarchaeota archaeon]